MSVLFVSWQTLLTGLLLAAVGGVDGLRGVIVVSHVRSSGAQCAEYGITGFAEKKFLQARRNCWQKGRLKSLGLTK